MTIVQKPYLSIYDKKKKKKRIQHGTYRIILFLLKLHSIDII